MVPNDQGMSPLTSEATRDSGDGVTVMVEGSEDPTSPVNPDRETDDL